MQSCMLVVESCHPGRQHCKCVNCVSAGSFCNAAGTSGHNGVGAGLAPGVDGVAAVARSKLPCARGAQVVLQPHLCSVQAALTPHCRSRSHKCIAGAVIVIAGAVICGMAQRVMHAFWSAHLCAGRRRLYVLDDIGAGGVPAGALCVNARRLHRLPRAPAAAPRQRLCIRPHSHHLPIDEDTMVSGSADQAPQLLVLCFAVETNLLLLAAYATDMDSHK
jgi:hypothetical protein